MSAPGDRPEAVERQPWSKGIAPAYIGTFLWVAFFDGLGRRTLPVGGLLPTLGGVAAGAVLAYLLLYRVPATWGFLAGRPLDDIAGSTFGTVGARLVPNLPLAVGQVALFAVAIGTATDFNLGGLITLGLIEPTAVGPVAWGSRIVPAPVFLVVALSWGVVTGLVGMTIVRWIAAIMQFFPVFPAVGLAIVVAGSFLGLRNFQPTGVDPGTGLPVALALGSRLAFLGAFQWTFGFASLLGIMGADWGAASPSPADVRKGGWVGLIVAPVVVASLALLAVAGNEGRARERAAALAELSPAPRSSAAIKSRALPAPASESAAANAPGRYTFRAAIDGGLDRRVAASVLIIFGLAALAPAVYAAYDFGRRPTRLVPAVPRLAGTLAGVAAGLTLIVLGWWARTDVIFSVLGALFAPIAGAMVAESVRHRRPDWPGPRRGTNPAGLLAWAVGVVVGLSPLLAPSDAVAKLPAAALLAFVAAFVVYSGAALVGLEPRAGGDAPA